MAQKVIDAEAILNRAKPLAQKQREKKSRNELTNSLRNAARMRDGYALEK
jgi:hypothetical protein